MCMMKIIMVYEKFMFYLDDILRRESTLLHIDPLGLTKLLSQDTQMLFSNF